MNILNQFLLITDLDNTLVGDDLATQRLNQYLDNHRQQYILVYATGRSYESAQGLMQERQLLEPDYWITGVGTEIYIQGNLDFVWANQISTDWRRNAIASFVTSRFPQLKLQPQAEQNPWKLSFHLHNSVQNHTIEKLINALQTSQIKAQVIFSSNVDVDILPIRANKGNAVQYIQQKLGVPTAKTLVCGDSGNDISMFQQFTLGVIVNNAQLELIEWHCANANENHYFAKNAYAEGIFEALQRFEMILD